MTLSRTVLTYLILKNTATLKSGSEVTQGHQKHQAKTGSMPECVNFTSYNAFKQSLTSNVLVKFCKVYFM